jgi:hypothetical protein
MKVTAALGLVVVSYGSLVIATDAVAAASNVPLIVAQAMVPATGANDSSKPMPMAERMSRRFPQPVRVGDLIGLPVIDGRHSTIGIVREVVRTAQDRVKLIVAYGGWFGWGARPVAVPIEVVGIEGRLVASLDMPPKDYAAAPTWHGTDATVLPADASIRIALARE